MTNYIFLDIDGVLALPQNKLSDKHESFEFDLKCVQILKEICREYEAKIVVTSSWRINKTISQLKELFSHYDLDMYIEDKLMDNIDYTERENGIKDYIIRNRINNYIIIDDMPFNNLKNNLIQTKLRTGLKFINKLDYLKIKNLLKKIE